MTTTLQKETFKKLFSAERQDTITIGCPAFLLKNKVFITNMDYYC